MVNNTSSKDAVLAILTTSNGYVSGESIAKKLNISRTAVKKAVDKLRAEGYNIQSVTNKGYLILLDGDVDANVIKANCSYNGEVIVYNQTVSTNVDAKILAEKENYGRSDVGNGKTVCIDYSSINVAKPFHIGHLSTTVIGGALYRTFKFLGYEKVFEIFGSSAYGYDNGGMLR